jgi:FAD/FMN-containing dehydrogenase
MYFDSLKNLIEGDIINEEKELINYSQDKSLFSAKPSLVVFPKNSQDIKNLIKFAKENNLSLTARAAGTDMSGGSITEEILVVFTKYFNKFEVYPEEKILITDPGVYFRDLESELNKYNLMLPSYPASKEICAIGGMVANNSGGEKTLKYGKTEDYVLGFKVVLSDGEEYYFEKIDENELQKKLSLENFEGEIYRKIYELIKNNYELIQKSRPKVSKNSSGYNIWKVYENGYFDLTKLFVGSQGTLGIITEIKLRLVEKEKFNSLLVIFLKDFDQINFLLKKVLPFEPTSMEVTDDHTFKIYLRYFKEILSILGVKGIFNNIKFFSPEIKLIFKLKKFPKLIVLIELEEKDEEILNKKISEIKNILTKNKFLFIVCKSELEKQKYWKLRRDTYKLLREKIKDRIAAPFVDDIIVDPHYFEEFLPQLIKILDKYRFLYTISGHLGDGNLHIIPLIDLNKEKNKLLPSMEEVYDLVLKYNGSITAEHNDGIVRGWYLKKMFGEEIYNIFENIKQIFDPYNIFNKEKKVNVTKEIFLKYLLK